MDAKDFSKYETARILGARSLQIAMNAPLLIKIEKEDLEKIKFDALKIAEIELNSNVLPISIKKPFPLKREGKLKRPKEVKVSEGQVEQLEHQEEKEIVEEGEIMGLAAPEEEEEEKTEEPSAEVE